jgi:hypothetical protein
VDRGVGGHPDQQVAVPVPVRGGDDGGDVVRLIVARSDQDPVAVEQGVDTAGEPDGAVAQQDEVVADPFEFGDDVRGQ